MARVLVVDDEEGIRAFIGEVLEGEGHEVVLAADGRVALAALARGSFHLMITDLRMPHVDGMTLLERARSERPEMEVVVLTAHGTVEGAVQAMKLGAFDYLQKPLQSPNELRLVVARALERRALIDRVDLAAHDGTSALGHLTFGDPTMVELVRQAEKVARTDATVLITGESGTGKEVLARAIHAASRRAKGPFVAVNCATLSDTLLESELFGHEKGAFTGASQRRRGKVELADGGTFFLDEIGEMTPNLQAKLLRVLQEKTFERVGGNQVLTADLRWIAATHRDLARAMGEGSFREDLYHRLAVFPLRLPPLRDRKVDLVPLADELMTRVARGLGRPGLVLRDDARQALATHDWPGNVRELVNTLERAAILAEGDAIGAADLGLVARPRESDAGAGTLQVAEKAAIIEALAAVGGHRKRAAERLGIGERTLYDKIKALGIGEPAKR
ncbi:MAG: sigma-54-dependent Fis family transcriptional regulator [Deltaproteobacteria bacterium]|nr:sigma-54-dependent Fis family transcriptional regulator [Deltaproteobacteria bacterium]